MRKFNLVAVLTLLICTLSVYGLEPSKVAFYTNNTAAQNVYVELKDYSSNTMLFRGETFSLAPNDNGIVIVNVNDYPAGGATGDWSGINASVINTSTMLDIYVNGTLFSQKRYDQLILVQAEATVLDNSGNFNPQTLNGTIGTDDNRWDDVYVGGNTLHIGPNNGDANNTEMELSYSGNTGTISINNTNVITATTSTVSTNDNLSVGGNIEFTSATGTILNSTFGAIGIGDDLTLVNDVDLILGNNSRIISPGGVVTVHDDLSVTAGNLSVSVLAGAGNRIVTANTTGVLSAGTALPAGTIVGTTDTQTLTNKSIDADNNTITNIDNADIKANAGIDATKLADGSVSNTELQQLGSITSAVVGITDSQTLTNKSIDADNNTITNIENADIKANAGIDATKLADGSVSSIELQYINTVTSNVQTQLDGKQANLPSQSGNSGRYLTTDGTNLSWGVVGGSTVSTNATINGDGSGGSPLGINLANSNTWTGAQTFDPSSGTFSINSSDGHIIITNTDNDSRQLRIQEPSGSGTHYISFEANALTSNTEYKFSNDGTNGQVLTTDGSGNLTWTTPSGGGGGGATIQTQTTTALTPIPASYTGAGVTFTLDANSSYLVRGDFQDVEVGGTSGRFDTRFTYTGTFAHVHFSNFVSSVVLDESNVEDLRQAADNAGTTPSVIEGVITTTTGGTLTLQFRENVDSTNDVNINAGGTIVLIKM